MQKKYPFRCKNHPNAQVRHEWCDDYITRNAIPVVRNEKFFCNACGKRLARNQKEASCFEG